MKLLPQKLRGNIFTSLLGDLRKMKDENYPFA